MNTSKIKNYFPNTLTLPRCHHQMEGSALRFLPEGGEGQKTEDPLVLEAIAHCLAGLQWEPTHEQQSEMAKVIDSGTI